MMRVPAIVLASILFGAAGAGCGGTNAGPGGGGAAHTSGDTAEQEATDEEVPGMGTPAYTAANNICSLLPLTELARQNNVKATADAVAKKVSESERTAADRKAAYQGCIDALKTE